MRVLKGVVCFILAIGESAIADDNLGQENTNSKKIISEIIADKYFMNGSCDRYLSDLTLLEQGVIKKVVVPIIVEDWAINFYGGGSLSGSIYKSLSDSGVALNGVVVEGVESLDGVGLFLNTYEGGQYSLDRVKESSKIYISMLESNNQSSAGIINKYLTCRSAAVSVGRDEDFDKVKGYVGYALARQRKASIGYFDVSIGKCSATKKLGTGNQFAEPKVWDGSRFFVVNAKFKNTDTESRLPVAGEMYVNYKGKEYKFDSVEPVMLEGYNIWFRQINPLVTMETKIVYRVPDEIEGEVFWKPGRNMSGTRLWCGYVRAAE